MELVEEPRVDRWVPETAPVPPLSLSTSGEGENRPGRAYLHLLLVVAKLAFFFWIKANLTKLALDEKRTGFGTTQLG